MTVKTGIAAALLFASLTSCGKVTGEGNDTLIVLSGNGTALTSFQKAVEKCGLQGISRILAERGTGEWIAVTGPSSVLTGEPFRCSIQYAMAHMTGPNALSMVGNAAK